MLDESRRAARMPKAASKQAQKSVSIGFEHASSIYKNATCFISFCDTAVKKSHRIDCNYRQHWQRAISYRRHKKKESSI